MSCQSRFSAHSESVHGSLWNFSSMASGLAVHYGIIFVGDSICGWPSEDESEDAENAGTSSLRSFGWRALRTSSREMHHVYTTGDKVCNSAHTLVMSRELSSVSSHADTWTIPPLPPPYEDYSPDSVSMYKEPSRRFPGRCPMQV